MHVVNRGVSKTIVSKLADIDFGTFGVGDPHTRSRSNRACHFVRIVDSSNSLSPLEPLLFNWPSCYLPSWLLSYNSGHVNAVDVLALPCWRAVQEDDHLFAR